MTESADILIVGGGIIGLTSAYFLAREGARVQLIDKSDFGQESSWAGAGILPPGDLAHARTPFDLLRAQSARLFPGLSQELRAATGIDNGFCPCGGLKFAGADAAAVANEWHGEGVQAEVLDEQAVRKLEPALAPRLGSALFLPALAQVRNPRHLKALIAANQLASVNMVPGCIAHSLVVQGAKIQGLHTSAGILRAGQYLLCTGAWTDPLLEPLGWRPGIHPVRGQIALLRTAAPLLGRVLLSGSRYLVPRHDGRILVGSTEEAAGFDKRTTAAAVHDLLALAFSFVPALALAQIERTWAGLRPGSPDGLPYLGPVPGIDNLFLAAGHFRAGIQLSPGTALLLKELLLRQTPTIPREPFRLDRQTAQR